MSRLAGHPVVSGPMRIGRHVVMWEVDMACNAPGEILAITDKRTAEAGNRRRQTVLLSATLHSNLDSLASLSLQDPSAVGFQVEVS